MKIARNVHLTTLKKHQIFILDAKFPKSLHDTRIKILQSAAMKT